ncbi:MAG TPA: YdeI/OmpD-associated family protein [Cytophagales bacterium]|nr:YdeI/OmpD-associated family protein [Cytophagales bacterium]
MVRFTAIIDRFAQKGEKTGWSYILVPLDIAEQLLPGNKKSFRVKGKLDKYAFEGVGLLPMGEGNFIMALNGTIRKAIRKEKDDEVQVEMEVDTQEKPLSSDFIECLNDEPIALDFFNSLPKGHQRYFSNWIETAKTDHTKIKRIAQAVNALAMNFGFGEMIRMNKKERE